MAPKAFKGKEKAKNPLSPSCPSAEQSGSTSSAGPTSDFASVEKHKKNLKFVSVTEESLHGLHDLDEQRSIRAHVMRDFLRQRSSDGQGKDLQPATMAEGPAQHITRFRLPNAKPRESASSGLRGQPTAGAAGNPGRRPNREVLPKTSPGVAATLLPREEDVPLHAPTTATFNQQKWHMQSNILANNASLSGGTSDPFSRLPIDASPETLELIHYYRHGFWQRSLAVNPEGAWFSYAATDPAMFHMTLSLVAQHRNLVLGQPVPEAYYHHRGEAIRIVTSRIGHFIDEISDSTIGAVAVLSSADQNMGWPYETLCSHINGLERMVALRGGVRALGVNETLERVVTWADLLHAASHDTVPRLGKTTCSAGYDLGGQFILPSDTTSPLELLCGAPPAVPNDLQDIFVHIRTMCIALESTDLIDLRTNNLNRRTFGNVLYHVEYMLLDPSPRPTPTTDADVAQFRLQQEAMAPLERACRYAGLVFTYLALRQLPIRAAFFDGLVQRLRVSLQQLLILNFDMALIDPRLAGLDPLDPPPKTRDLSILLWLLVEGWTASSIGRRSSDRAWFGSHAATLCRSRGILSEDELKTECKKTVWLESHCGPAVHALWLEIMTSNDIDLAF